MKKYFNNCEVNDFSEKIAENMDITISITGNWLGSYDSEMLPEDNHEVIIECKVDSYEEFAETLKLYEMEFEEIYSVSVSCNNN